MVITDYNIPAALPQPLTIALVTDLHDRSYRRIAQAFEQRPPELIAIAGDLTNTRPSESANASGLLRLAASIAPCVYSLGNHERFFDDEDREYVSHCGVQLLEDSFTTLCGITVGGLSSGYLGVERHRLRRTPPPSLELLRELSEQDGFKLLLCHHPEYYEQYIRPLPIDLTLSGHAHGGQIRLFGQGLFSPGQGLLPRYTSGVHEGRLVVSRGLSNSTPVPRFFNPTELVYITLGDR